MVDDKIINIEISKEEMEQIIEVFELVQNHLDSGYLNEKHLKLLFELKEIVKEY